MHNVALPQRLDIRSVGQLYASVIDEERNPHHVVFLLDFRNLNFAEPAGVAALLNLITFFKENHLIYHFNLPQQSTEAIRYLDRVGFFQFSLGQRLNAFSLNRDTTFDFVDMSRRWAWLENNLIQWLTKQTGHNPPSFALLKTSLLEVLHNIHDHSETKIGCIFAQHYPRLKKILISISDMGVGIPHNVNEFLNGREILTDVETLERACQFGFTTKSTPGNAGRGLPTLVDIVAKNHKGCVRILSNRGYLEYEGRSLDKSSNDNQFIFPGCSIELEISMRNIQNIDSDDEEFEW